MLTCLPRAALPLLACLLAAARIDLLSDGLKSRVVFAFMSRTTPHLLLLDEPTNHLDIETIDALAEAINKFEGGLVLVSHDMRLISQVAKEIWECDHRVRVRGAGTLNTLLCRQATDSLIL